MLSLRAHLWLSIFLQRLIGYRRAQSLMWALNGWKRTPYGWGR